MRAGLKMTKLHLGSLWLNGMNEICAGSVNSGNVQNNDLFRNGLCYTRTAASSLTGIKPLMSRTPISTLFLKEIHNYSALIWPSKSQRDSETPELLFVPIGRQLRLKQKSGNGVVGDSGELKMNCRLQKHARMVRVAHILLFARGRKPPYPRREWEMQRGTQMSW